MYVWNSVTLYLCFKIFAPLDKSGTNAIGIARAALCRINSRRRAFLGVDVLVAYPFSRTGNVSRPNNVLVSAKCNIFG